MRKIYFSSRDLADKKIISTFAVAKLWCHSSVGRAKDWKSLCPRFDSWWHHSKEKQNNVKSWFSTKIGIFYFPKNDNDCASECNIKISWMLRNECSQSSRCEATQKSAVHDRFWWSKRWSKRVFQTSPPRKSVFRWFTIFCIVSKRVQIPTFVELMFNRK